MITKDNIRAAIEVTLAIGHAVRELKQVPAGHLYAQVMHVLTLEQFEAVVATLCKAGVVRREASHMLVWIGPAQPLSESQPKPVQEIKFADESLCESK